MSGNCSSPLEPSCQPDRCRWRCAIEVIDELLSEPSIVTRREADDLLDLRWQLVNAEDAEGTLRTFCAVRRRMERRHYLAFFRIRRWLENQIVANVTLSPGGSQQQITLKLDHYCVEALRRASLCIAMRKGAVLDRPSLRFIYRQKQVNRSSTRSADTDRITASTT
jgi:hypothetical protein